MNLEEFRKEMEAYRRAVDKEAVSLKESYQALERLHSLYDRFDAEERQLADQVLADWVLDDDEAVRFDALALITDFRIKTAEQALQKLASRLATSARPGAPYELKKVNRILALLGEP
jgi:cysteinyl-tRNA synthetase